MAFDDVDTHSVPVLAALVELCKDGHVQVRSNAVWALKSMDRDSEPAIAALTGSDQGRRLQMFGATPPGPCNGSAARRNL